MFILKYAISTFFGLFQTLTYSESWDVKLNELLDKYENEPDNVEVDTYTIELGSTLIWIGNEYYSYGNFYSRYGDKSLNKYRPSIKTMGRLDKLVYNIRLKNKLLSKQKHESLFGGIKV